MVFLPNQLTYIYREREREHQSERKSNVRHSPLKIMVSSLCETKTIQVISYHVSVLTIKSVLSGPTRT